MLNELTENTEVYLVRGYSDMRKGIDGLAAVVQGNLSLDPFSRSLFLFCGRSRCKVKGLLWEGDGFLLLYKRLDKGSFKWPRNETEAKNIHKKTSIGQTWYERMASLGNQSLLENGRNAEYCNNKRKPHNGRILQSPGTL